MSVLLRARLQRVLVRSIVIGLSAAVGITLLAYAIDSIVFRYRVHPFGQITVNSYDAVQQKNGKTEFLFNPPEAQTCVHALFPHAGFVPCWYLQRHTEPRTDI
jgi:hypothetical protein